MANLVPSTVVLDTWVEIKQARSWAGLSEEAWVRLATQLGDPDLDSLLLIAGMAEADFLNAVNGLERAYSPLQKTAAKLMYNAIKNKYGMPTNILQEPMAAALASPAVVETQSMAIQAAPKVHLASTIDQAKIIDVPLMSKENLRSLRANYIVMAGGEPMPHVDVSDNQLSALSYLLEHELPPYTDFGVWGPFGARRERKNRFKAQILDSRGRWTTMEVPGPDTLEAWRQCWRVFATAATMLKLATQSTLSKYEMQFERRCERYHYAWHLCVQADNRCRAEYWAAECRRQEAHHQQHPSLSGFRPEMPWDSVIAESAMSSEFWQEELMEPAIAYQRVRGPAPTTSIHQQFEPVEAEETVPHVRRPRGSGKGEKAQGKGAPKRSHEPCFNFNRQEKGCREPCPQGRFHGCEGCRAPGKRSVNCECGYAAQPAKKRRKGDKGSGK